MILQAKIGSSIFGELARQTGWYFDPVGQPYERSMRHAHSLTAFNSQASNCDMCLDNTFAKHF